MLIIFIIGYIHSFISKSHTAYRLQHIYITYIHYVQINNHVGEWECLWNNMEYGIWFCINNKYIAKKIYVHRHWSDLRIYIRKYSIAHLLRDWILLVCFSWRYEATEVPRVNFVMREALFEIYTWILCRFIPSWETNK